ncbi:MAG: methionyl-tRNA formyltransferase [Bdellovibrionales bacterium]|nr:methionyl-tRNA formyltransferase [Bdellovibrionales bacterium]
MKTFSYIFAGTSEISLTCLKILLQQEFLQLKGLISQTDKAKGRKLKKQASAIKKFALSNQIPCWTPSSFKDSSFLEDIKQISADFCFVCAYGQILSPSFLNLFPKSCLNLHFSLLPKWRGASPIQQALMNGDSKTGVSLQIMTEKLDAGDVIASQEIPIQSEDNAQSLFEKSFDVTQHLLKEKLLFYFQGKIKATVQNSLQATYAPKIDKKTARIEWNKENFVIHNKVRALVLGPQAFCFFKNKRLKIYRTQISPHLAGGFQAGEVYEVGKNKLSIACGKGVLNILELQKEGKKRQKIQDFLKGHFIQKKDCFT